MNEDTIKKGHDTEGVELVYATHGRIIGVDIGNWSGFLAGPVILEQDDESRIELRYNESSEGPVPKLGMSVSVEYTGEYIHVIKHLKLLENYVSAAERLKDIPESSRLIRIPMPPAAKTFAGILFMLGVITVGLAIFGDFEKYHAKESILVYLILAAIDFMICGGIWYYTDDS